MKKPAAYISLIFPPLLLAIGCMAVYPFYRHYIDPDAVAYLTLSKRYAAGDVLIAVNGYWSPWSCWLTAGLIKQGLEAFKAALIINAIGAMAFLIAAQVLFVRFIKDRITSGALSATLALFLVYALFKQSFADLWYVFFLMVALLLMLQKKFLNRPVLWIIAGTCGAFAYFAKAYAFPYFIGSTMVVVALLVKQKNAAFSIREWLKVAGVMLLCFFIISAPWLWMLHEKYHVWTTSTSGSLNLSWYLIGHPFFKEGITLLIPPVYPDAVYYWEDPFLVNGAAPHFWHSPKLLLMQIVRAGYTVLKFVNSINELSAFFSLIIGIAIAIVFSKKIRAFFSRELYILCVVFLLFPMGYWLINFESRYLWYWLPLSMVIGALLIGRLDGLFPNKKIRYGILTLFCISYLIFPVWDMKALYRVGEKEFQLAQELKKENISGSFASNIYQLTPMQKVIRVAYFSENSFYYMPWPPQNKQEFLHELRRYQVHYYFHFHEPFEGENSQFTDENGMPFPLVFEDNVLLGLRVYKLR